MNFAHYTPPTLLLRQLRQARIRSFIGREAELRAFRTALTERAHAFTVLYLHGPGGIGKSTLLQRLADEAQLMRLPVSWFHPAPMQAGDEDPAPDLSGPPVVLIDGLDRWLQPEQWLRYCVLPTLPTGSLIVVASRRPPSTAWRADLGWSDILLPLVLGPLSPEESTALLQAHNVPAERQSIAHTLGCGNPLALRVAAQTIMADPDGRTDEELSSNLALSIFDQLIGDIPSRAHRRALEICAHAATTNEGLLQAAIPGEDAAELFEWLRGLPFISSGARGIHPSDVVRNVVETELRWRHSDQYDDMHTRVKEHVIRRARSVTADAVLPFAADVCFLERHETARSYFTRLSGFEVQEHRYEPADLHPVLEMARQAEGDESAALAEFWLERQPEAFRVYRRPGERPPLAFSALLRLSHPTNEELARDPIVAAGWAGTRRVMPLRPAEYLGLARFAVDPASYHRPSEAMDLIQLRMAASIMCDDDLIWSVVPSPDPDFWAPMIERTHRMAGGPPVIIGGRAFTLFSQYWGPMSPAAGSEPGDDQLLSRLTTPTTISHQRTTDWTRTDFDQAVREALRSWRRPDVLADSRMARSRMVAEAGGEDPVAGLRRVVSAALDTLRSDPRQTKFHRVLVTTFFDGVPTQEAAAERLDLPYSTYRRHLAQGLAGLCAMLWKAETHGIGFLDS